MANDFSAFAIGRVFYARELLSQLKKVFFLAQTVSRKYSIFGAVRGGIIRVPNIRIPAAVEWVSGTPLTFGNTTVTAVDVKLDKYVVVPMSIDSIDQVLSDIDFRTQMALRAAYEIAEKVEGYLSGLYWGIGQYVGDADEQAWADGSGNPSTVKAIAALALLDKAGAPVAPRFGALSTGGKQSALLNPSFTQFNTAGVASTLVTGDLGLRFGVMWGLAQSMPTHTGGGTTAWGSPLIDNAGGYAAGVSTIHIDTTGTATAALKKGDAFLLGGNYYSLAADATAVGSELDILLAQPLLTAVTDDQALTAAEGVRTGVQQLVYLPEAFAFATAPLDDNRPGTDSSIVIDDQTGLAIRVTYSYDHANLRHLFTTELLCGAALVRPELAVRIVTQS